MLNKKVFIGHGHSRIWLELKNFLEHRLNLECDEFDRKAAAGKTVKERLESMLEDATFAFLILTAETQRGDEKWHPRDNVIHEVGLFQGRLGFDRAIVLLEEGCDEFTNIAGLVQIRFPKGDIAARFEPIRQVLEDRGVL